MKIAVYSIALNEAKHVERWYKSAQDADIVLLADTGSTDNTVSLAETFGVQVFNIVVDPWRFDNARNASLALIPSDVDLCVQLDLDEVLRPGWRAVLESAWNEGNVWPIYKHVTERHADGSARTYQHYFKIHPRKGFFWKYPIHEVVLPQANFSGERKVIDLEVDHLMDTTKSRQSYLGLLEKAVEEMPSDWRMNCYLTREYFYEKDWVKVISSAYKALAIIGGWDVERASTSMWASEAAQKLEFFPLMEQFAKRATEEAPHFLEAWHWRSHVSHLMQKWEECHNFASKVFELKRQEHYLVKPDVWEWWAYDLYALSSYKLGKFEMAVEFGSMAAKNAPSISRLQTNLQFYKDALDSQTTFGP